MPSEAAKTTEHESEDQGQTASSQPSQAPTAAEPRNTNEHRRNDDGKSTAVCSRKNGNGKGWRDDVAQLGPADQRTTLGPLLAFWSQLARGPRFP